MFFLQWAFLCQYSYIQDRFSPRVSYDSFGRNDLKNTSYLTNCHNLLHRTRLQVVMFYFKRHLSHKQHSKIMDLFNYNWSITTPMSYDFTSHILYETTLLDTKTIRKGLGHRRKFQSHVIWQVSFIPWRS